MYVFNSFLCNSERALEATKDHTWASEGFITAFDGGPLFQGRSPCPSGLLEAADLKLWSCDAYKSACTRTLSFSLPPDINLVLQFNNICPPPYVRITWYASEDFFCTRKIRYKIMPFLMLTFGNLDFKFLASGAQLDSLSLETQLEI